jgi:hypothetical protein
MAAEKRPWWLTDEEIRLDTRLIALSKATAARVLLVRAGVLFDEEDTWTGSRPSPMRRSSGAGRGARAVRQVYVKAVEQARAGDGGPPGCETRSTSSVVELAQLVRARLGTGASERSPQIAPCVTPEDTLSAAGIGHQATSRVPAGRASLPGHMVST